MTGQQPGSGGVMTGADKGACETLTGTPYVGGAQLLQACGANAPADRSAMLVVGGMLTLALRCFAALYNAPWVRGIFFTVVKS